MDFDKVRYYSSGIGFTLLTLGCTLIIIKESFSYDYVYSHQYVKTVVFCLIVIAISVPTALFTLKKARERTNRDENNVD